MVAKFKCSFWSVPPPTFQLRPRPLSKVFLYIQTCNKTFVLRSKMVRTKDYFLCSTLPNLFCRHEKCLFSCNRFPAGFLSYGFVSSQAFFWEMTTCTPLNTCASLLAETNNCNIIIVIFTFTCRWFLVDGSSMDILK